MISLGFPIFTNFQRNSFRVQILEDFYRQRFFDFVNLGIASIAPVFGFIHKECEAEWSNKNGQLFKRLFSTTSLW